MVIGSLARRVPNPNHFYRNAKSLIPFSTSSDGRGRSRSDGSPSPQISFSARVLGQPVESESPLEGTSLSRGSAPDSGRGRSDGSPSPQVSRGSAPDSGLGRGYGHGRAQPSSPVLPSFTSIVRPAGRGRPIGPPSNDKEDVLGHVEEIKPESLNVISSLGTADFGRGKPLKREAQAPGQEMNRHARPEKPRFENQNQRSPGEAPSQEANRHARPQRPMSPTKSTPRPKISKEDALKNAKKILSRNDDDEEDDHRRGPRGRREGSGRSRERGHRFDNEYNSVDRFKDDDYAEDKDEEYDEKEEERKKREAMIEMLGEEKYEELQEAIDELVGEFYPDEDLLRAHEINNSIEFEPEFAMEFDSNPDIDEEPPLPLRDVLEKVKPFMMAYEGIGSQEEWEETVEETMKLAPTLKQLVDGYSGPDRITAKQEIEELEGVSKALPQSAPASVQRFTDRALLSLQSNPGWAFGKKTQFMDKLVREFSQQRN